MGRRFETEEEIFALVRAFEAATIDRESWRHAEHLTVALYYCSTDSLEAATQKMRFGILNLLRNGFRIDNTKEMPYHETLTVFWMRTVAAFNEAEKGASLLEKANALAANYDKDYPLRFYSREYLFSARARAEFVEGDLVCRIDS